MSYSEAIQFLYRLQLFGMKLGLEKVLRLADLAGNPQKGLRFIHVAGTNGKGSTCAMLEEIYRRAGLRVGLYTSPHLVSFGERIQVDRKLISEADVARLVEEMQALVSDPAFAEAPPTFFEVVTIMALKYFAEQRCELVIWETGLGGRLDATNIVTPMVSVITNVQLDHQKWLGETVAEIAREKGGIIKPGVPVITGATEVDALQVISEISRVQNAPLTIVNPDNIEVGEFDIGLQGGHQKNNAAVAMAVVSVLQEKIPVPEKAIRAGLKEVQWAGRLQTVLRRGQTILLDCAHNPAGAQTLADEVAKIRPGGSGEARPGLALILGTMRDKDYPAICKILAPLASKIYLSPVNSERTVDAGMLQWHCRSANPLAEVIVCENLAAALARAQDESFVVVAGSIQFVGEAMELLHLAPASTERALNDYSASSIRAVTLDVGGTLIQPWPSVGHVYSEVAAQYGFDVSPEILNGRFFVAWLAKKDFSHSKSDWADLVDQTFSGLIEAIPSRTFFPAVYEAFAFPAAWRIFDDVIPCLKELRRRGLKLAVISNWDERLRPLLNGLGLDLWFDSIVVSAEVGRAKPDAAVFQRAARELGVDCASILHVGDNSVEDYKGARAAGFQSRWIQRGEPPVSGFRISSLSEILK